jgi:hypothetical protein
VKVCILASPNAKHQQAHAEAMKLGMETHGLSAMIIATQTQVDADVVVCWGWRIGQQHVARGRRVLVMERGYLGDRFAWTSLGWDGLNGRARFSEQRDDGERFRENFGHLMQPWRIGGEYVLIVGQVPGDAALQGKCLRSWYVQQAERASKRYGLPVKFRPHPLAARRGGPSSIHGAQTLGGELSEALGGAALVITYNSNTGVESILAGRPTVAVDAGSMVNGIALQDIPPSLDVFEPDRETWANRLAWRQFRLSEVQSGLAWDVVRSA